MQRILFGSFKDVKRFQFYSCENLVSAFYELAHKFLTTQNNEMESSSPMTAGEPPTDTTLLTTTKRRKGRPPKTDSTKVQKKYELKDVNRMLQTIIVVIVITEASLLKNSFKGKGQLINCVTKPQYGNQSLVNEVFIDLSQMESNNLKEMDEEKKWLHFLRHADGQHNITEYNFAVYSENKGIKQALMKLESLVSDHNFVAILRRADTRDGDLKEQGKRRGERGGIGDTVCAIHLIKEGKKSAKGIAGKRDYRPLMGWQRLCVFNWP